MRWPFEPENKPHPDVEEFLDRAFQVGAVFPAREWADGDCEEETPANDSVSTVLSGEPGSYARLECPACGMQKDAWYDENGNLEDERDAAHWHEGEGPRGGPVEHRMRPVGDDTA